MAKAHSVHFDAFGSIQPTGIVPGFNKYSQYLEKIISRHFDDHIDVMEKHFSDAELDEVFDYLGTVKKYCDKELSVGVVKPSFVMYDQHVRNFMVDPNTGKPTGYFDIEYGQSAHPNLEIGGSGLALFGFFSSKYVPSARDAFMKGYSAMNGPEEINDQKLETVHTANHLLSAVKSYDGKKDGIRDGWSDEFAKMVLGIIREGKVNCYDAFTDLVRPVTKQPTHPN
jgi:hypothetical protein